MKHPATKAHPATPRWWIPAVGAFVALAVAAAAQARRATHRKEVLRVGRWRHPDTGEVLEFSLEDLERLAADTNAWIALGHKVWFASPTAANPSAHNNDPNGVLGYWDRFGVEGGLLMADVEPISPAVEADLGTKIRDVSVGIWFKAESSTGQTFAAVIEHVAGTPSPVIPGQTNFVRLAREIEMATTTTTQTTVKKVDDPPAAQAQAAVAAAPPPSALAPAASATTEAASAPASTAPAGGDPLAALGLPPDADEGQAVEAVRSWFKAKAEEAKVSENPEMARLSRKVAELEARDRAREQDATNARKKSAAETVAAARLECLDLGHDMGTDAAESAKALLERPDETSQKAGRQILDLARANAKAKVGLAGAGAKPIKTPDAAKVAQAKQNDIDTRIRCARAKGGRIERDGDAVTAVMPGGKKVKLS